MRSRLSRARRAGGERRRVRAGCDAALLEPLLLRQLGLPSGNMIAPVRSRLSWSTRRLVHSDHGQLTLTDAWLTALLPGCSSAWPSSAPETVAWATRVRGKGRGTQPGGARVSASSIASRECVVSRGAGGLGPPLLCTRGVVVGGLCVGFRKAAGFGGRSSSLRDLPRSRPLPRRRSKARRAPTQRPRTRFAVVHIGSACSFSP
jgi:hypothetical protein